MVQLLFTRGHSMLSSLICEATGSASSHMAVHLVPERLVYHFLLDGLHIESVADFLRERDVIDKVELPLDDEQRKVFVAHFIALTPTKAYRYDYSAFMWWGWHAMMCRLTGEPMPERNRGNQRYAFLCTELLYMVQSAYVEAANRWLWMPGTNDDLAIMPPDEVCEMIKEGIKR